jgi:hypothetical protein
MSISDKLKISVCGDLSSWAKVQSILDDVSKPIISGLMEITSLTRDMNLSYKAIINVDDILCSSANRAGLGLNPYNCHRNGAKIMQVGCDPKQLTNAVSIEMPSDPKRRQFEFNFNAKLHEIGQGLLAQPSGAERFISLGCCHFTGFARAVKAGCRTSEASIKNADGKINVAKIRNDKEMAAVLDNGFENTVFKDAAIVVWPRLADYAQRALNAMHSVASLSTEMEVSSAIGEFAERYEGTLTTDDWKVCAAAAVSGTEQCAEYVDALVTLNQIYGGGPGSPIVKELDLFSKCLGQNVRIGEEVMRAVVGIKFDDVAIFGRLRQAILAANLSTPKIQDGIAKCILKGDITKLKSIPKADLFTHEADMQHARALVEQYIPGDVLPFWRFVVRLVCFLVRKGKDSFEAREYTSIDDIKHTFLAEVDASEAHSQKYKPGSIKHKWGALDDVTPFVAAGQVLAMTLDAATCPKLLLERAGFALGKACVEKSNRNTLYIIEALGNNVDVKQHLLHGSPLKASFALSIFLKNWSPYTNDMPAIMPTKAIRSLMDTQVGALDAFTTAYFSKLSEYEEMKAMPTQASIVYHIRPNEVLSDAPIAKRGALIFAPSTKLLGLAAGIKKPTDPRSCHTGHKTTLPDGSIAEIYISAPPFPASVVMKDLKKDLFFQPFFWVKNVNDPEAANCELKRIKFDGATIPIITNIRAIAAYEPFSVFKAAIAPAALKDALPKTTAAESSASNKRQKHGSVALDVML